jgi:hypothetical protein
MADTWLLTDGSQMNDGMTPEVYCGVGTFSQINP